LAYGKNSHSYNEKYGLLYN